MLILLQFTRAIRKITLTRSPLLRSSFLLISRRSLRRFMQTAFYASMKSVRMNLQVNCNDTIIKGYFPDYNRDF